MGITEPTVSQPRLSIRYCSFVTSVSQVPLMTMYLLTVKFCENGLVPVDFKAIKVEDKRAISGAVFEQPARPSRTHAKSR